MTIAIWCILIAGTLPYVAFGLVKGLDPSQPRAGVAGLDGRAARAYGAQLDGFETFPIFAAAVIVSHVAGEPKHDRDILAVVYVLRIGHMVYHRSPALAVGRLYRGATGRGDHPSGFSLTSGCLPEPPVSARPRRRGAPRSHRRPRR